MLRRTLNCFDENYAENHDADDCENCDAAAANNAVAVAAAKFDLIVTFTFNDYCLNLVHLSRFKFCAYQCQYQVYPVRFLLVSGLNRLP